MTLAERVAQARAGTNDKVICRMRSGWAVIGDALLDVTKAHRINYEILGNSEPELHAHIFPRYEDEPEEKRRMPVWFYDWNAAWTYSALEHGPLQEAIRRALESAASRNRQTAGQ